MEIRNETPFATEITLGPGPDRTPHLGVILKATYTIPEALDAPPEIAAEQQPVVPADEFRLGDPTASIEAGADAVAFKPRADIVLDGTAYVPRGVPATFVDAGLRVGRTEALVRVWGDRRWEMPLAGGYRISAPEPFVAMPLVYERAFGGADPVDGTLSAHNPTGRGMIGTAERASVEGRSLPNIEDPVRLIQAVEDRPDPVGFGVIARSWAPRTGFLGPPDAPDPMLAIDPAFWNGAHPCLQVPGYLTGDEAVDLLCVTPDGHRRFQLPGVRARMAVYVTPAAGGAFQTVPLAPVLDTLVLLPDAGVFTLSWRGSLRLGDAAEAALLRVAGIRVGAERLAAG